MGTFNDLPKDVMWLIFQPLIHAWQNVHYRLCLGYRLRTKMHFYYQLPQVDSPDWMLGVLVRDFAMISKRTLSLIRSKCYKLQPIGWNFIN